MKTFNISDIIFATVTQRGNTIYSAQLSGISSMADLIRALREALGVVGGLLTLHLRNGSQGWASRTAFMLAPAA